MSTTNSSAVELRHQFVQLKNSKYRIHRAIYTDGSKQTQQCGFSVVSEDLVIRRKVNELCSIFAAEGLAVKEALKWVANQQQVGAYLICTDSMSVITSLECVRINSTWKDEMTLIHNQILSQGTEVIFCWVPSHVGIPGNEHADREAKLALNEPYTTESKLDFKEIKTIIKSRIIWRWQAAWTQTRNNMLREVKNSVTPYVLAVGNTRRESVVLSRLRIGHTSLTHGYLLERTTAPACQLCNATLTIKHLFVDCPALEKERKEAKIPENMREALADDANRAKYVLQFMKNINLLDVI